MKNLLDQEQFNFLSPANKEFILAFNDRMTELGYDFGSRIGDGYCWGKYMIIYRKSNVKSERVYARIYIREKSILLRLFLNDIEKHCGYIENAPAHIHEVFCGGTGDCQHCHNEKDGSCRFRKTYTLDGRLIEKCNGIVFEFHDPGLEKLPDYISLFAEFYPQRK